MTAPTYETCRDPKCGAWQRVDLLGDRCTSCGKSLLIADDSAEKSPIVARHPFKSASLRRAEQAAGSPP